MKTQNRKVEKSAASQNDPTNDAHNQSDPSKTVEHPEPPVPWLALINISNTTQLGILAFVLAYTIIKLGYLLFPIVNTALFTAEVDSSILTQINNAIEKAGSAENVQFLLPEKWPHAVYKQGFNGLCRTNDDSKTVCYYGTNTVKLFMNDIALQIAEYNQIKGLSAFEEKFLNFLGLENGDSSNGVLPVLIAVVIYEVAAILAPLRTFGNPYDLVIPSLASMMLVCYMFSLVDGFKTDWRNLQPFLTHWLAPLELHTYIAASIGLAGSLAVLMVAGTRIGVIRRAASRWKMANRIRKNEKEGTS